MFVKHDKMLCNIPYSNVHESSICIHLQHQEAFVSSHEGGDFLYCGTIGPRRVFYFDF